MLLQVMHMYFVGISSNNAMKIILSYVSIDVVWFLCSSKKQEYVIFHITASNGDASSIAISF